ncbi:MAG: hypothetical protein ABIT08_13675 [Bacteroidia bacterium]
MRSEADDYTEGMDELAKIFSSRDRFVERCIPLLKIFLLQQHPAIAVIGVPVQKHIYKRCKLTAHTLWEKLAGIVHCSENNISPANVRGINMERIKKYLATYCSPPAIVTEEKYKDQKGYLQKWIDEENTGNYNRWNKKEEYVSAFINAVQEFFFNYYPALLNMESEWWMVYKYSLHFEALFFQSRSQSIETHDPAV